MKQIVTIKGKPVIEIYESFNGSYWYVTEKAWKQDSLISGKVYKNDQIYFGYVKLANCPQFAEFGYFSEAELKRLGWRVWKVHKQTKSQAGSYARGLPSVRMRQVDVILQGTTIFLHSVLLAVVLISEVALGNPD